jgi:hypothetical protein
MYPLLQVQALASATSATDAPHTVAPLKPLSLCVPVLISKHKHIFV